MARTVWMDRWRYGCNRVRGMWRLWTRHLHAFARAWNPPTVKATIEMVVMTKARMASRRDMRVGRLPHRSSTCRRSQMTGTDPAEFTCIVTVPSCTRVAETSALITGTSSSSEAA